MAHTKLSGTTANWLAVLLPSVVVVLFNLLRPRLPAPTAGGLAFLAVVLIAYWLFPRRRLSRARVLASVLLALAVALLMGLLLARTA